MSYQCRHIWTTDRYRLLDTVGYFGEDPTFYHNSIGYRHGRIWAVQRLTDEGSASSWEFVAIFMSQSDAREYINRCVESE